jgi:outer membrane protein assembly factor BamD
MAAKKIIVKDTLLLRAGDYPNMRGCMNSCKVHILISVLLLTLTLVGCAGRDAVVEKPADELLDDGIRQYDKGNFKKAVEAFEQLKDWYPFSKFAILAELKIADAHFQMDEYADAVFAYEEFEKLHPRNEAIPYVIYQIGMSHFRQVDTVDRDQTSARKAIAAFDRLIQQYPQNPHAHLAQGYINKCVKSIAGNEFYVAVYYYRMEHYKAAIERFKKVVNNYSDMGYHTQALAYIHNCETLFKIQQETEPKKDDIFFMPE